MSYDVEQALLTKILEDCDIRSVLKDKITPEFFSDEDLRDVFVWLTKKYQKRGKVPSLKLVQREFPNYEPIETDDDLLVLVDEMKQAKLYEDLAVAVKEIAEATKEDPFLGFEKIRQKAGELSLVHSSVDDEDITKSTDEMEEEYDRLKEGESLTGIPYPWEYANQLTLGMQQGELIGFYGRPKCIPLDQPVLNADGSFSTIEEVSKVISLRGGTRLTYGAVDGHHERVLSKVVRLTTETGYSVRVGVEHRMLEHEGGYVKAGCYRVGSYIAVARRIPCPKQSSRSLTPDVAELLGLLIGDGGYAGNGLSFTKADKGVLARVSGLIDPYGCVLSRRPNSDVDYDIVKASRRFSQDGSRRNLVVDLLRKHGLWGSKSVDKVLPDQIFVSGKLAVSAMLGGLLSTDGSATKTAVLWSTSSEVMAGQIKHLLLRLGVVGSLRYRAKTDSYIVTVHSAEQHEVLLSALGPYVSAEHKLLGMRRLLSGKAGRKRHNDGIPYSADLMQRLDFAKNVSGKEWSAIPWKGMSRGKLFRRTGVISRHLLRLAADTFGSKDLMQIADSDVRYEKIVSVEEESAQWCADISVAGAPNFVVGDFITHNSKKTWVALAIADHIHTETGWVPVFFSCEMNLKIIRRRLAAMRAKVEYSAYRAGKLTEKEEKRFRKAMKDLRESPPFVLCRVKSKGTAALTEIKSKCEEYGADVAIIDGLYFMMPEVSSNNFRTLTQGCVEIAESLKISVAVTTQANRDGEKSKGDRSDDVAFGDSLTQDCSQLFRLVVEQVHRERKEIMITMPAIREAEGGAFVINALPAHDFSQKHVMDMSEAKDAMGENDDDGYHSL